MDLAVENEAFGCGYRSKLTNHLQVLAEFFLHVVGFGVEGPYGGDEPLRGLGEPLHL